MKKKRFSTKWSDGAEADLEAIIRYIARDSVVRAIAVNERIYEAVDSLCEHPNRGRVLPELEECGLAEFREIIVGPHRVIYRHENKQVVVIAVIDGRRNVREQLFDILLRS